MTGLDFEPTHYTDRPGGDALCGAPMRHPFNVATDERMVECECCREIMDADTEATP